jgi:hypothetical protein
MDFAPNCGTQGLDCTLVRNHIPDGFWDIVIQNLFVIHDIFASRIELIELADGIVVIQSLDGPQTSPQAVRRENGFEQASCRN